MSPERQVLLNLLRASQIREWSQKPPSARLEMAEEMRQFAYQLQSRSSTSDEPLALLRATAHRRRSLAQP